MAAEQLRVKDLRRRIELQAQRPNATVFHRINFTIGIDFGEQPRQCPHQ